MFIDSKNVFAAIDLFMLNKYGSELRARSFWSATRSRGIFKLDDDLECCISVEMFEPLEPQPIVIPDPQRTFIPSE